MVEVAGVQVEVVPQAPPTPQAMGVELVLRYLKRLPLERCLHLEVHLQGEEVVALREEAPWTMWMLIHHPRFVP